MFPARRLELSLAGLGFVILAVAAWPFTVDDAFIAARYAQRLNAGLGYTFNATAPTDGVTGPLWLLPLVVGARAGLDVMWVGKLCGAACALVSVLWVVARARSRSLGRCASWVTLSACLSSLPLVLWSVAGLETGAAMLAATGLALAVTARPEPRAISAGVAIAALAWLRPELALWASAWLVALAFRDRKSAWTALALGSVGALSVLAFRFHMFGHWLPMSAAAKPPLLAHGLRYVASALGLASVAALVLVASAWRYGRRDDRVLCAALLSHGLGVVLAGGDWMPGMRLFAPVAPVFALVLGVGVAGALRSPWSFRARSTALVALAWLLLVNGTSVARELRAARAAGANRAVRVPALIEQLRDVRGPIAALDVGALGYFSAHAIVDLGGLTEPTIAYARGAHLDKHVDSAWLQAVSPALIVLHSRDRPRVDEARRLRWYSGYPVERRVLRMPWVARMYRVRGVFEYASDYFYVLLEPLPDRGRP